MIAISYPTASAEGLVDSHAYTVLGAYKIKDKSGKVIS